MRGKQRTLAILLTITLSVAAGCFYFSPREPLPDDFRDALNSSNDSDFAEDLGKVRELSREDSASAVPAPAAGYAGSGSDGLVPIVIYHTTDIRLYPGSPAAGPDSRRLSALAAMIEQETRPRLWIDSGGWFRKASEGGSRQFEEIFALLNRVKPAAVVLGARDLDRLDDTASRLVKEARFPILAAGFFSVAEPYPGIKIGILGISSGTPAGADIPGNLKDGEPKKRIAETGGAVQRLRSEGVALIVAAAHVSAEGSGNRSKDAGNEQPLNAETIRGADLILGGATLAEGVEQIVVFVDPRTGRVGRTETRAIPLDDHLSRDFKPAAAGGGKTSADKGSVASRIMRKLRERIRPTLPGGGEPAGKAGAAHDTAGGQGEADAPLQAVIESRLKQPGIKKCILGALTYLDDTQIRKRPGRNNSQCDLSDGSGCRSTIKVSLPGRKNPAFVPMPGLRLKNAEGEWASYIHVGEGSKRLPAGVQDSNMFVTAFVSYPLFLVDDRDLPPGRRSVSRMRQMAMKNVNKYKRGDGYSFWRPAGGKDGEGPAIAPPNLPTSALSITDKLFQHRQLGKLLAWASKRIDPAMIEWMHIVSDPKKNPTGKDAFFNIPNDADDTSVAVANQALHAAEYDPRSPDPYYRDPANFSVDLDALKKLERHRDIGRKKSDSYHALNALKKPGRDRDGGPGRSPEYKVLDDWQGDNTGAYMTWLKDDKLPIFGSPESGVIPGAVNIVDEVVNANAVFSMGVNGIKDTDGFRSACGLIAAAAETKHWQKEFVYYPQRMIFPYTASRAFRDGGADNEVMKGAMGKLLADVLADQAGFEKKNPRKKGAFPGGMDPSTDLSTALGVTFLLNVGRDLAAERGLAEQYDRALAGGIDYLVKNRSSHSAAYDDTFTPDAGGKKPQGLKWKEGLFFAGDPQNMSQWVSEAYTTSMVLEAMNKYALAYDQSGRSIRDTGRLKLAAQPDGGKLDVQWSPGNAVR